MDKILTEIKVVIVDSHVATRIGLHTLLNNNDIQVVAEARNIAECSTLSELHKDAIFIIDSNLTPDSNIPSVITAYKLKKIKIIVYSSIQLNSETTLLFYRAGAFAVLSKTTDENILIEAIHKVHEGSNYFLPGIAEQLMSFVSQGKPDNLADALSKNEYKVFMLTASGMKPADIAKELDFSVGTIHNRLSSIRMKLNCSNLDMHKIAQQHGLIS
jgi:DNA-binding NarL/FixJ family response regulator